MSTKVLYRTAAVLLLLFAIGHQLGFRQVDPSWNAGVVVQAMQGVRFHVQGFDRTYWEFFTGFGFFCTVLLLFSAFFAWSVGGATAETRRAFLPLLWAFAIAYMNIAILTWRYFFAVPAVLSMLIALALVAAAARAGGDQAA